MAETKVILVAASCTIPQGKRYGYAEVDEINKYLSEGWEIKKSRIHTCSKYCNVWNTIYHSQEGERFLVVAQVHCVAQRHIYSPLNLYGVHHF